MRANKAWTDRAGQPQRRPNPDRILSTLQHCNVDHEVRVHDTPTRPGMRSRIERRMRFAVKCLFYSHDASLTATNPV
ncbi:hypothetical protein CALVIDRAFT_535406 [Calocera viscosa TUFC12733]|uniref:Uncharacterized protein n=1 Tax=Calocera viscosa (strain TUFC12733) TaxID=1330018 RepID=A0A167P1N4_CALVF|nr:hypothetical protein CALVIDRAFT_535406 [Calocera viscosa TUFC12733]